jgi:hypothetical protein
VGRFSRAQQSPLFATKLNKILQTMIPAYWLVLSRFCNKHTILRTTFYLPYSVFVTRSIQVLWLFFRTQDWPRLATKPPRDHHKPRMDTPQLRLLLWGWPSTTNFSLLLYERSITIFVPLSYVINYNREFYISGSLIRIFRKYSHYIINIPKFSYCFQSVFWIGLVGHVSTTLQQQRHLSS